MNQNFKHKYTGYGEQWVPGIYKGKSHINISQFTKYIQANYKVNDTFILKLFYSNMCFQVRNKTRDMETLGEKKIDR